jgi:SpoIID/LytB domain protein
MLRGTPAVLASLTVAAALLAPPAPAARATEPPGVAPGGFRLEAGDDATLVVPGLGRFSDTIEVVPGPDGRLQVVNELSLDAYVEGLAEMPAGWHGEALKAQAVAARSYAWFTYARGYYLEQGLDFDICGTTACQVFKGREIVETPGVGKRWAAAVADTAGEVLSYEDRPILARFFSTSGGATRANEDVFPSTGPRPYLQAVDDPHDAVSPLHRWTVKFSRAEFDAIMARGDTLGAAVPVAGVRRISAPGEEDVIRLTRANGHQVEISASKFRFWVSDVAPQLFPDRFPQRRDDGGPMPATLPSSRLDFEVTDTQVIVRGRGWGHGVGMSQYGAKGRAEAGQTYDQILGAYYGGLSPAPHPAAPERIRVGLTWDAREVSVRVDGYVKVLTDVAETDARSGIPWTFRADGDRVELTSRPPATFGPRTTPTRRLPRPAPNATPEAVAGEVPADRDGTRPAAAPHAADARPDAAVAPETSSGPAVTAGDRSLVAALADGVGATAPGVRGALDLVRSALRLFGG